MSFLHASNIWIVYSFDTPQHTHIFHLPHCGPLGAQGFLQEVGG